MDSGDRFVRLEVPFNGSTPDTNHYLCGAIIPPTPISRRRHQADGLVSLLQIYMSYSDKEVWMDIPIKYCPFCGKEIKE